MKTRLGNESKRLNTDLQADLRRSCRPLGHCVGLLTVSEASAEQTTNCSRDRRKLLPTLTKASPLHAGNGLLQSLAVKDCVAFFGLVFELDSLALVPGLCGISCTAVSMNAPRLWVVKPKGLMSLHDRPMLRGHDCTGNDVF